MNYPLISVVLRTLLTTFWIGLAWALTPGAYESTPDDASGVGAIIALWAFFLALIVATWAFPS